MGLRGGGVRTLENKGHAHLQYSVAVFLGDVSTAVITQLAGVLQSLPGYFGEKIASFARNRLASSFLPRIICHFALVSTHRRLSLKVLN